ncbi:MAG TPA: PQQ-binding-like beta-propeller repeat protein [Bacteroidales bacterium]|nr:PQQ-binding-like beta-propeller repeat protein [Bacteroidales bacterium]
MKLNLNEKDIGILKVVSQIAGGFTLIVALTMIFSLIQLKTINPLDNPVLMSIKDQYDKDPANASNAEQVRAMDLMARKAYFSSRWQVETGSYLLLAGAILFILCQRLISDNQKPAPALPGAKQDQLNKQEKNRRYLIAAASVISLTAIVSSFILRGDLPDPTGGSSGIEQADGKSNVTAPKPDKTDYPGFRGQDSRGIAGGSGYPIEWDGESGKNIEWKIEVPKPGQSSPVIWGDKLFVTGAEGNDLEVFCIGKKTGKILWTGLASNIEGEPDEVPETDQDAGMAVSSAAVNKNVVCAVFANGNLVCFDHDGKLKWSKNIGLPANAYGYSSSLIIYEDLLIVQFDSNEKISLMGFESETGELKWETLRRGRAVWSSPVIAYFGGKPQIVLNGNPNVTSYDAVTGKELWTIECMSGDVAPSVAVNNTMVYAVTDYAMLAAIKPGAIPSIVWSDNTFTPDASSPVANDQFLFVTTGNGDIACYDSEKGDTLWTRYYLDQFYASPIIADDMVYLLDRSGVMHIVRAQPSYELVSESPLGERTDCTPAFSDKKIYIRGKKNLYCIAKN